MSSVVYKTYTAKPGELPRAWHVADAAGIPLGRLASRVAYMLRGKHKPKFTPHVDCGDGVIVINAAKVALTGKKLEKKHHFHHSGYPGGVKLQYYKDVMVQKPEKAIHWAVWGMLPKGRLGHRQITHLKVYRGDTHPHIAQAPQPMKLEI